MEVVLYPGPALRRGGKRITSFDAELAETARQMLDTMYRARGVGLAAPQVGLDLDLLVLNPSGDPEDRDGEMVLINTEIVARKGNEFGEEGCLSFPGIYAEIERAKKVTVRYQDLEGNEHEARVDGFLARIIQHEADHLRGVLFIDRMSSVEKLRVRNALQDLERQYQAARA
jgi:peptide deformylase